MIILLVTKHVSWFSVLLAGLRQRQEIEVVSATDGRSGLEALKTKVIDLVIVDEQFDDMSGIQFVKHLVMINPLVNTVIVSILPAEDFHEATEGLGVLMQLPPQPQGGDAEKLLAVLARITGLMQTQAKKAEGA